MQFSRFPCFTRAYLALLLLSALCFAVSAHEKLAAKAATPSGTYADSSSELERLAKDILRALKDGKPEASAAPISALTQSIPESWFHDTFGAYSEQIYAQYAKARPNLESGLKDFFQGMARKNPIPIIASKHLATCDDDSGELIYPVLAARSVQVPLYELRFQKGKRMRRLWALAYVGGAFRLVGNLLPPNEFPPDGVNDSAEGGGSAGAPPQLETRIRLGGSVAASQLIRQIAPEYPEIARLELLQGAVKLHVLIAKDGSVRNLQVLSGYCSFSDAAVRAVRQWQYKPTLLDGEPVLVDTTIEINYSLKR